jgi:spermidine synthase
VEAPIQSVTKRRALQPGSAVTAAVALIGFSAVVAQIVLMRELIVVFNGNEISLGIMLAAWLFWTAAGSSSIGALRLREPGGARRAVAALECLLAVSLLPTLWALRTAKSFFQTVPGELVGPLPMLLASLVCLSVFCIVSGALFAAAARMVETERAVPARAAVGSAYLLEAAGSGLGGILASLVLLRFFDPFQIAALVALLNLSMAAMLLQRMSRRLAWAAGAAAALFAVFLLAYAAPMLERSAQARLWRGFHLAGSRNSIYGNLAVIETGNLRSIYDNGTLLGSAPDEAAAEEAVHYALLEHPAPKNVLLIGGGVSGGISQALKHPTVERIDYVELDPALITVARQFFPAEPAAWAADSRVHLHYADGRSYLKASGRSFDAIILNVPDPQTAQLNRFYTVEFFRSARDHLAPGGVLAFQLRSSEETISPNLAEFLRCIQRTLKEVFPYVAVIPGDTIHFFASARPGVLTEDPKILMARLRERHLQTRYVREYFIPYRMMPDRMAQVHEQLEPLASTPINRDFAPAAYYFDILLWSAQFKGGYSHWFQAAAHTGFNSVAATVFVPLAIATILLALVGSHQQRARSAAACCTAATGFTLIALQIFVLLAFQSIYGYVYSQLAILIGLGMAGIAVGSWLGLRRAARGNLAPCRVLAANQFLLALSAPALIFVAGLLAAASGVAATSLAAQLAFPALAALCGVLGGYQFPIANEIYLHDAGGRTGLGGLYAVDLLGGCAGALLLSTYLIPVFGFWRTAWLTAAINLAPALLAARAALAANTISFERWATRRRTDLHGE